MNPDKISKEDKLKAIIPAISKELDILTNELEFRVNRIKKLVMEAKKCL